MYNLSKTCQIPNLNQIYEKYFGLFANNKMFVEVGAYDGESVSNTSGLADAGWKGIYIEPVHENYLKCLERHYQNDVIISNVSIGVDFGIKKIYNNGILSSLDEEHALIGVNKFNYPKYKEESCFQLTMDKFLRIYDVPRNFDLLVVDVEGRERQVFDSFNLREWRPKMMIIELVDKHLYFQDNVGIVNKVKELRTFIQQSGYKEIFRDDINTIFIDHDFVQ